MQVRVSIQDEGVGLQPDEAKSIFDAFQRTAAARSGGVAGLGLGLAIAKGIAGSHGGTISVTSAGPGQGCTFTVALPRYATLNMEGSDAFNSPSLAPAHCPSDATH